MSKAATRRIEVFRPGTFVPMQGGSVTFSADDLRAWAAAYDAEKAPAPAVVGHPTHDAPAFGWAKSFSYDEEAQRLVAELGEVEQTFADAVSEGRYKKISLSLFPPNAPNNPTPGSYYPKHIGFLGAAAPAVSGLKPVQFAEGDEVTIEFADPAMVRDLAGLFRSLREWVIEKFGADAADRALPGWNIGWIEDSAARAQALEQQGRPDIVPAFTEPTVIKSMETRMSDDTARAAELARREALIDARERALTHADNVSFAESLIDGGKLLPAVKDKVVGLLDALSPTGASAAMEVSFADGGTTAKQGAADLLKDVLKAQPKVVSFGAVDTGNDPVDFADAEAIAAKAQEFQAKQAASGIAVSASQAVEHVTKGAAK